MKVLIATAMYPRADNPAYGAFVHAQVEALKRADVEVELFRVRVREGKFKYPKSVHALARRLAVSKPDLIHAHFSYVGALARTQWQVPVVVTFHGDDLLGERDTRGDITIISQVIARGGQILAHLVDACIVQTEEMADKVRGTNVHIIPHEINLELYHPIPREQARAALGLAYDKKYLLFAANPQVPVKNFPFAQATADYLIARDPAIELLVIHKETQERLALYMNACDALIFPSYQEGSPNIVKQSMACNLPIVASDVGDVREIIGTTAGCAVRPLQVPAFAESLTEILDKCERTQGRSQVLHLDSRIVAEKIIGVYNAVLDKHRLRKDKQT